MNGRTALIALGACLFGTGCFIVDGSLRPSQDPDMDPQGGTDMAGLDLGEDGPRVVDTCGTPDAPYIELFDTQSSIRIDTTDLTDQIQSCDSRDAPGNDGFVAVNVTAGQYWHFHLRPDPAVRQDRDPFLYLLFSSGTSCDDRQCNFRSDVCQGGKDEHFAFEADQNGVWYLGIDDRMEGGGVYLLDAILPFCGNGERDHGESCDDPASDECDSQCRNVLSEDRSSEAAPNDNAVEANVLDFPASNMLEISGAIGGDECTYPDVFAFTVPAGGATLAVRALNPETNDPCFDPTLTPYRYVLRRDDGQVRDGPETDSVTGCAVLDEDLAEGSYNLFVEHAEPFEDLISYKFRISLTR